VREDENKNGLIHKNAAMYIVEIMGMLNKLKQ
jgi:hypothetical protein